jgi:tight adherence protein B
MQLETVILICASLTAALLVWGLVRMVLAVLPSHQTRVQARLAPRGESDPHAAEALYLLRKKPEALHTRHSQWLVRYEQRLQLVAPEMTLPKLAALCACTGLICGMIVGWVGGVVLGAIVALMAAWTPLLVINARRSRREKILADQLIDALDFLARVLRAGHSFSTGLHMCSEELPQPIAEEFRRCYDVHSMGIPMEQALTQMAERMDLTDFSFFVTSVIIQRQTGGDLSEILSNIAMMIRGRIRLQQQVKALTSEGRATGVVLAALPVLIFLAMWMINPNYARFLFDNQAGRIMVGVSVLLIIIGVVMIRRIVTIKV